MKKERFTAYRETDYMYASALARAKEKGIIGKEGLDRLIDAEPSALLAEYGYLPSAKDGISPEERNEALDETLARRFDEIEEVLPILEGETYSIVTPLRYPYDYNNVKAALKCSIRGVSPEGMLFEIGTVSADTAVALVTADIKSDDAKPNRKSRTRGLPKSMKEALKEAKTSYAASKNPRVIDFILDRACYADMLAVAEAMGVPYLIDYVKLKIDAANLLTALRIDKMYAGKSAVSNDLLKNALLMGGKLELSSLSGGREAVLELMNRDCRFEKAATAIAENDSLSEAESALDSVISEFIANSKRVSFGAEVPLGYLLSLELSVKNVRTVMARKGS